VELGNTCSFGQKWRDASFSIFLCCNSTTHHSNVGGKVIYSGNLRLIAKVKIILISTPSLENRESSGKISGIQRMAVKSLLLIGQA
jgi:hypothetical protein